jgi:uncharacterized protein (TIGR02145 family)
MRKLILTTAAVAAAIAGTFAAEPSFGTFTDGRNGQKYKTVKIGTQTWMAQNLNYQIGGSWCYEDSISYCKQYGRLYDWKTAKTVCPKGWKLPSREDWDKLVTTVGREEIAGKKLKSKNGWNDDEGKSLNGTDDFGFSALPGGNRYSNGNFYDIGYNGYWWTARELWDDFAYLRTIYHDDDVVYEDYNNEDYGHSVRCVADSP